MELFNIYSMVVAACRSGERTISFPPFCFHLTETNLDVVTWFIQMNGAVANE